jgi:hypothetical protein
MESVEANELVWIICHGWGQDSAFHFSAQRICAAAATGSDARWGTIYPHSKKTPDPLPASGVFCVPWMTN